MHDLPRNLERSSTQQTHLCIIYIYRLLSSDHAYVCIYPRTSLPKTKHKNKKVLTLVTYDKCNPIRIILSYVCMSIRWIGNLTSLMFTCWWPSLQGKRATRLDTTIIILPDLLSLPPRAVSTTLYYYYFRVYKTQHLLYESIKYVYSHIVLYILMRIEI